MHFFTEPDKLIQQTPEQSFGPVASDPTNQYNVGTSFHVNQGAKVFACQDSLMIVQPYVDATTGIVDPLLLNIVLKPMKGLEIPFDNVKYYIYRGVEVESFVTAADPTVIIPKTASDKTEFIDKFWKNWDAYVANANPTNTAITSKSFGYNDTLPDTTLLEEIFNSQASSNTEINELQAIKVSEGEWIANLLVTNEFTFEIIIDTDHLDLNLGYVRKSKQVIDVTGLPTTTPAEKFLLKATKEKILNYVDPAAFFGGYYEKGVNVSKTSRLKKDTIYTDVLSKFLNKSKVYLDIRSEQGYSYDYYENYEELVINNDIISRNILSIKSQNSSVWNYVDKLDTDIFWPIILLDDSYISPGEIINLRLRVDDNQEPILFARNPSLFGTASTNNFKQATDLIDVIAGSPSYEWTKQVNLQIPFVAGTPKTNVTHHIKLQYFRTQDNATSPDTVLKNSKYLDAAFGGIHIPALNIPNPFQHINNSKTALINGGGFAYVATNGIYQDDNLVLFYGDNAYSLLKSNDVFPKIDISKQTQNPVVESPLLRKDIVYNKWQINEGGTIIDILEMVGYNKTKNQTTPTEDLFFLGLTKTELSTLDSLSGISNLHHKYFLFEEILNQKDSITGTAYKKYKLKVQGLDNAGKITTKSPVSDIFVYGSNVNMLCSKDFASATNISVLLPDPGTFTEYPHAGYFKYDKSDVDVQAIFPTFPKGIVSIKDRTRVKVVSGGVVTYPMRDITTPWRVEVKAEVFFPANKPFTKSPTDMAPGAFPLIVMIHGNGHHFDEYKQLGEHLAKNGFIFASISCLYLLDTFRLNSLTSGGIDSSVTDAGITYNYFFYSNAEYIYSSTSKKVAKREENFETGVITITPLPLKEGSAPTDDFEIIGTPPVIAIRFKKLQATQGMHAFGRANVLYPHLKVLKKKFDTQISNDIGLIGHSRGGEAVVRAVKDILGISGSQAPPPTLKNVKAVMSLAPTDIWDEEILDKDIPYYVLYGSMDGDVSGYIAVEPGIKNRNSGFSIYDRVKKSTEKSMTFVHGATHNGFITDNHDFKVFQFPSSITSKLLPDVTQKRIMLAYTNAFFRSHLRGEAIWKSIFQGAYVPTSTNVGLKEIQQQYKIMSSGQSEKIIDFDKIPVQIGLSDGQVSINTDNANLVIDDVIKKDSQTPHATKGLVVTWGIGTTLSTRDTLIFHISSTGKDIRLFSFLSFRISHLFNYVTPKPTSAGIPDRENLYLSKVSSNSNMFDSSGTKYNKFKLKNEWAKLVSKFPYRFGIPKSLDNLSIGLEDTDGRNYSIALPKKIIEPYTREHKNLQMTSYDSKGTGTLLDDEFTLLFGNFTKSAMGTIRVPLSEFANNGVKLNKVKSFKIIFPVGIGGVSGSGKVVIDDVEFTN